MLFKKTTAVAACAAALASFASAASAQTAPAAAPAPQPLRQGPPIAGLCTYSSDRLMEVSVTAKGVQTRLDAIRGEIKAELDRDRAALNKDITDFNAQAPAMQIEAREQRQNQLQVREKQGERKLQIRSQEFQATEEKQTAVLQRAIMPLIAQAYQNRNCSVLLAGGVLIANPQMDITGDVAKALDVALKPFSFNRENLMQQPAAAAAAPKPAAATPPKK
jgi:Skp family chaperone for outer membrane proteins